MISRAPLANLISVDQKPVTRSARSRLFSAGSPIQRLEADMKTRLTENDIEAILIGKYGLAPGNAIRQKRNIKTIKTVWGFTEPSMSNLLRLKAAMIKAGREPTSIRQYMWSMKYWAKAAGGDLDFKDAPLPDLVQKKVNIIDFDIVNRIIDDDELGLRDRAIMCVFACSACRVGELVSINIDEVNHVEHTILLHDHKTKHDKTCFLPPRYYTILHEYMQTRAEFLESVGKQTDALFVSSNTSTRLTTDGVRQLMYRIAYKYGIDMKHPKGSGTHKHVLRPHVMRHTGTTRLREILGNSDEVRSITGHATTEMIDRYSHARDAEIHRKMQDFKY